MAATPPSGGASLVRPWLGFHTPLIEPDMQIFRIRLSDKTSRLHHDGPRSRRVPGGPRIGGVRRNLPSCWRSDAASRTFHAILCKCYGDAKPWSSCAKNKTARSRIR
jgi:hypothetical protein